MSFSNFIVPNPYELFGFKVYKLKNPFYEPYKFIDESSIMQYFQRDMYVETYQPVE